MSGIIEAVPVREEFRAGVVLSETFALFFQRWVPLCAISAVGTAPLLAFALYLALAPESRQWHLPAFQGATVLSSLLVYPVVNGMITFAVLEHLRGRRVHLGECLLKGISALLPLIAVTLLGGLLAGLAALACLVPGIVLMIRYFVAAPVVVVERPGAWRALKRSEALTHGYRWHVLAVFLVIGVINGAIGAVEGTVFAQTDPFALRIYFVSSVVTGIFTSALYGTSSALIYYRLRRVKESFDFHDLASVFD